MLTIVLLIFSNVFMTIAWYWHLKGGMAKPLPTVILLSWAIALVEYCFAVPANRLGYASGWSGGQLKIAQEVITLAVFVPFSVYFMGEPLKLDFLWAGLCLMGAVYFVFRAA